MSNILTRIVNRLKRKFEKPQRYYQIDGFAMDMGEGHTLSLAQKYNKMYDRFVPYLAQLAEKENEWIIDIGANVGDTTAAMVKHTKANILCVEPTAKFYSLLEKNVANFGAEYSKRIVMINAYVAANEIQYTSVCMGGYCHYAGNC